MLSCVEQPPEALQSACTHSSTSTWLMLPRSRDCSYREVDDNQSKPKVSSLHKSSSVFLLPIVSTQTSDEKMEGGIRILMVVWNKCDRAGE